MKPTVTLIVGGVITSGDLTNWNTLEVLPRHRFRICLYCGHDALSNLEETMTSVFANRVLFLAVSSGTWGLIGIVLLLVLCCGGMLFGMRGMGNRPDGTDKARDRKPDDKPR